MNNIKRLRDARRTLRIFEHLELSETDWGRVAAASTELFRALRAQDDEALKRVIGKLQQIGARRGESSDVAPQERYSLPASAFGLAEKLAHVAAELDDALVEVTRIPHIDVNGQTPLRPGQAFSVDVYLGLGAARPGETSEELRARLLPYDAATIDVWLTATPHFDIKSPSTQTVELRASEPTSTFATFELAVRESLPDNATAPAVEARFDYRLRASGSVRRDLTILGSEDAGVPIREVQPAGVTLHPNEMPPDLAVGIARIPGPAYGYQIKVATEHLGGVRLECEWNFGTDPREYVREVMAGFTDDWASPLARSLALRGAGIAFFADTPSEFRDFYWRLVDNEVPLRSLMLVSEERSVPWELMIPERRLTDGTWETRAPLGVECAIGRWHDARYSVPGQRIPLSDSLVLAPEYMPPLPKAREERDLVLGLFPGHDVPATFDELELFFRDNSASLLHFVCHGEDATVQAIRLLQSGVLTAQHVLGGSVSASCRASRPLVFLNACELGRPGQGLASVGGFPASFIESDAGGIIAPLWQVEDTVAHEVAVAFYQSVKEEPLTPFAETLRRLRARAYGEDGRDSFAAYVYYGDPLAAPERRT